jgi:hypothetical protein
MSELDNPAGRLHELFVRFAKARDETILRAWANALNTHPDLVTQHLGEVLALVEDTRRAAAASGQASFRRIPEHLDSFIVAVFPTDQTFATGQASSVEPSATALEALGMLSAYLSQHQPEPDIPLEEIAELKRQVGELMATVTDSALPPEVKRPLLHRLADIMAAIEHIAVRGPEAVRFAAEALGASAVIYEDEDEPEVNAAIFQQLRTFAKRTWFVFAAGAILPRAGIGWDHMFHFAEHLISPPSAPKQLPPGNDSP